MQTTTQYHQVLTPKSFMVSSLKKKLIYKIWLNPIFFFILYNISLHKLISPTLALFPAQFSVHNIYTLDSWSTRFQIVVENLYYKIISICIGKFHCYVFVSKYLYYFRDYIIDLVFESLKQQFKDLMYYKKNTLEFKLFNRNSCHM